MRIQEEQAILKISQNTQTLEKRVQAKYKNVIENIIGTLHNGEPEANLDSQFLQ